MPSTALFRPLGLLAMILAGLTGCASAAPTWRLVERPVAARSPVPDLERDRAAILAMLGEYQVRFSFEETVVLQPGYVRRETKDTGAFETVVLVEEGPRHLVLQHLLVSEDGEHVTKHWRQDWTFEATTRFEFTEAQTWRVRPLDAALTRGAWTQCVYEVDDAPRYCGTGRWEYRGDIATWTSDATWRPLPRREYTVRSDYNALRAINRHSITPSGWTHEQDNTKTLREGETPVAERVREFGFNDYRRVEGFDFTPAREYWDATKAYWAQVRAQWEARLEAGAGLSLKTAVDGMELIIPLFTQAQSVGSGQAVTPEQIARVLDAWVVAPGALAAEPAVPEPEAGRASESEGTASGY